MYVYVDCLSLSYTLFSDVIGYFCAGIMFRDDLVQPVERSDSFLASIPQNMPGYDEVMALLPNF